MPFVDDDQRKAAFARMRSGQRSNGYTYPSFIHGAPDTGSRPAPNSRPNTPPQGPGRILGSTTVYIPGLPYAQGTIQTTPATRPVHGGGLPTFRYGFSWDGGVWHDLFQGGYATSAEWWAALSPPRQVSFMQFMFGNTVFNGSFTLGPENMQGGSQEFVPGPPTINWQGDWHDGTTPNQPNTNEAHTDPLNRWLDYAGTHIGNILGVDD